MAAKRQYKDEVTQAYADGIAKGREIAMSEVSADRVEKLTPEMILDAYLRESGSSKTVATSPLAQASCYAIRAYGDQRVRIAIAWLESEAGE